MNEQDIVRNKVRDYLQDAKSRNPAYSMRALARHLNVPASNLSDFLQGKRSFSHKTIEQITFKLCQSPEERKDILDNINALLLEKIKRSNTSNYEYQTLTEEEFQELDEWYYYALRTFLSLKDSKLDLSLISSKLNITVEQAENALTKLVKLGLLRINENNEAERTKKHLKTPDVCIKDQETIRIMRKIHEQVIQHSIKALHHCDRAKRDITWVNIPANSRNFDKARELIRKFQDDMMSLLEDGEGDEVYRLTIQLCPVGF